MRNLESDESFKDLETLCMIIGFGRSGHSLIGALLDAHPNMIIAHEQNVLKPISEGLGESEIYHLLLENSRKTTRKTGRWSHVVPNQWQGRFQKLRVIGDKGGGVKDSDCLQRLSETVTLKKKFIFVVRNPFDNISTIATRKNWSLERSMKRYFRRCERMVEIKKKIATGDLFEFRHESFIDNAKVLLRQLRHFLGEDATDDYLTACARIVYKSPHKSRFEASWDHELIAAVKDRMAHFTFLTGYSFEN